MSHQRTVENDEAHHKLDSQSIVVQGVLWGLLMPEEMQGGLVHTAFKLGQISPDCKAVMLTNDVML